MDVKLFKELIERRGWQWAEGACPEGSRKGKHGYFVQAPERQVYHKGIGLQPACIHVTLDIINKNANIDFIERSLPDLAYVTRIVGYFSQINNWNLGKRGEMKDRLLGDYNVTDKEWVNKNRPKK